MTMDDLVEVRTLQPGSRFSFTVEPSVELEVMAAIGILRGLQPKKMVLVRYVKKAMVMLMDGDELVHDLRELP